MCPRSHILVIDDDHSLLDVLVLTLADAGYSAVPYTRGSQAAAAARVTRPNLVLTDLMMPGMDGVAVIEHLRADHGAGLPIILMTASQNLDVLVARLHLAGGIQKPFHMEDLLSRIRRALAHSA